MSYQDKILKQMQQKDSIDFSLEQQEKELPVDELELFTPSPFYHVDNLRSVPAALELRLRNGESEAIPYSDIRKLKYRPSEGIEVICVSDRVKITGRNLRQLYLFLAAFRIRYIEANIGHDLTEENVPFVKEIFIEEI